MTKSEVSVQKRTEEEKEKFLDDTLAFVSTKKLSFAKVSWGTGKGPYILAFETEEDATYCECNAWEYKSIGLHDLKGMKEIPIWECGAKTPEQVNALPKMNIEKAKADLIKAKEDRKKARAEKMKATKAIKKEEKHAKI